jgi:hypothetical protein
MAGARRLENEIRVGLDEQAAKGAGVGATNSEVRSSGSQATPALEIVTFGKTARQHVREFGLLFGAICFGVAAWKLYLREDLIKPASWLVPGIIFAGLGCFAPRTLLPVWRAWMKFAHYLSIVTTAVLLAVTWCVGFLPIAMMLRVIGVKRIDRSFQDATRASYWEPRDPKYDDFQRLKLQY